MIRFSSLTVSLPQFAKVYIFIWAHAHLVPSFYPNILSPSFFKGGGGGLSRLVYVLKKLFLNKPILYKQFNVIADFFD